MSLIKLPQLNQPVSRHESDAEDITCTHVLQRIDEGTYTLYNCSWLFILKNVV